MQRRSQDLHDSTFFFIPEIRVKVFCVFFLETLRISSKRITHRFLCSSSSCADKPLFLRTYCETDIDPAHRKYTQLQAAIRYLLGKEPDLECRFTTPNICVHTGFISTPL